MQMKTGNGFTYNGSSMLILERLLDVLRRFFELPEVFDFGVPIQLSLCRCDIDLVGCRGLVTVFEDGIQLVHGLDVDAQIVHKY